MRMDHTGLWFSGGRGMIHIMVVQNSELVVIGTCSIIIYGGFWVLVGGNVNTG